MSVNCPLLNGAVQLLVPEYVPVMLVLVIAVAEPLMLIAHVGNADTPPAGTTIVKVNAVPLSAPERLPRNWTVPAGVRAAIVPDIVLPICVTTHDIVPGPEESDAMPE